MNLRRNEHGDIHRDDLIAFLYEEGAIQFVPEDVRFMVEEGAPFVWLIKWTCPVCGERASSDEPNTISAVGYRHDEKADGSPCGGRYTEPWLGVAVIAGIDQDQAWRMLNPEKDPA